MRGEIEAAAGSSGSSLKDRYRRPRQAGLDPLHGLCSRSRRTPGDHSRNADLLGPLAGLTCLMFSGERLYMAGWPTQGRESHRTRQGNQIGDTHSAGGRVARPSMTSARHSN